MVKTARIVGDMFGELAREKTGREPKFRAHVLTDEHEIEEARKLAIEEFSKRGKIPKEEIDENGLLTDDPFLGNSTFFGVYDTEGELGAVARLIWSEKTTVDNMRLPTEKIDEEYARQLEAAEPGKIAEFGSLAKKHGVPNVATLKLISAIFDFAKNNGIEDLVCGLEPKLYPAYKQMFGGALHRLNEENIEFPGIHGEQVPLIINVEDGLSYNPSKMYAGEIGHVAVGTAIRFFLRNNKQY